MCGVVEFAATGHRLWVLREDMRWDRGRSAAFLGCFSDLRRSSIGWDELDEQRHGDGVGAGAGGRRRRDTICLGTTQSTRELEDEVEAGRRRQSCIHFLYSTTSD